MVCIVQPSLSPRSSPAAWRLAKCPNCHLRARKEKERKNLALQLPARVTVWTLCASYLRHLLADKVADGFAPLRFSFGSRFEALMDGRIDVPALAVSPGVGSHHPARVFQHGH